MFLAILIPILFVYAYCQHYFITTQRELKRLDSVASSPVFSHFSETIDGVSTIRAFGHSDRFTRLSDAKLDKNQGVYFLMMAANCWLGNSFFPDFYLLGRSTQFYAVCLSRSGGRGFSSIFSSSFVNFNYSALPW